MATYGSEPGVEAINSHFIGGYTANSVPTAQAVGDGISSFAETAAESTARSRQRFGPPPLRDGAPRGLLNSLHHNAPAGAKVCSQGRKPLGTVPLRSVSPSGATVLLTASGLLPPLQG